MHLCDAPTAHSLISHLNITFSRKSVSVKHKKTVSGFLLLYRFALGEKNQYKIQNSSLAI